MEFQWFGNEVKQSIKDSKKEICNQWGLMLTGEYQSRTPVVSGKMKQHETFDTLPNDDGIWVGTTPEADYALFVEIGSSKQKAQHVLQNTVNDSIGRLESRASDIVSSKLGK